jgi:glycosyltransferase involved in cell wall biosynthesis
MELYLFLDPLESLKGPLTPAFLMALETRANFDTVFVSQLFSKTVSSRLDELRFRTIKYEKRFLFKGSLLTMEAWLRKSGVNLELNKKVIVNFSQCFLVNAHIYYAQGPMTIALEEMYPDMRKTHKFVYSASKGLLRINDLAFLRKLRAKSNFFIANSKSCANMYERLGIKIDDIIYPPLDCQQFKSTTNHPSKNYVVSYFGKETKYPALKAIADKGIKIRAFGSKRAYIPSYILKHPNIKFENDISDLGLANLYSHALFTLFTFNHEPFGYIPVESMACGIPVLTYNRQGPSETILNHETGWLMERDSDLVEKALILWKSGYSSEMGAKCRARALEFDASEIIRKWLEFFKSIEHLHK